MEELRILARTLVVNDSKILLVRNKGADFWYPPGGGWEYRRETITGCAVREVAEETGCKVAVKRMLWLQEFHVEGKIFFETFWLAELDEKSDKAAGKSRHIDLDPTGMVEEARWFKQEELVDLKVFPKRVKSFQDAISSILGTEDPFIGTFK
jgi:8-oxo-dGTP diphosphatase